MTDSNQNSTDQERRLAEQRARTAKREAEGPQVGDKVTDPEILAELEKEKNINQTTQVVQPDNSDTDNFGLLPGETAEDFREKVRTGQVDITEGELGLDTDTQVTRVTETPDVKGKYDKDAEQISKNANEQLEIIDDLKKKYPNPDPDLSGDGNMELEWDPEDLKKYNDAVASLNESKDKLKEILNKECKTKQTDKGKAFKDTPTCESFLNSAAYRKARNTLIEPVDLPDPCGKGELSKINTALLRFFKRLKAFKKYGQDFLDSATLKVQRIQNLIQSTKDIIAGALKSLMQKTRNWLIGKIRDAIDKLVDKLFPLLARKLKNTLVGEIINQVLCKFKGIIDSLGNLVGDFLFELIGKVVNIPFCAAQQFANALINNVVSMVDKAIGPVLDAVNSLLGGVGKIAGSVFQAIDFVLGLESYLCAKPNCPEIKDFKPDPWNMGGALKSFDDDFANFSEPTGDGVNKYIDNISIFGDKLGDAPTDIPSSITRCDVSSFRCGPPKIEIFGGGGVAAAGQAVVDRIGRVIGVNVTNSGAGYDRPPFVTIIDPCENGDYASAYAEIEDGKVTRIVMVNPGNGYLNAPNGFTEFDDPDGIATILPFPVEDIADNEVNDYIVCLDGFEIISTGVGYTPEDEITITPDIPNLRAGVQMTQAGQIIGIDLVESVCGLTDIPVITINSPTGAGAQIKPILSFSKIEDSIDPIDQRLPETVIFADISEGQETIAALAQRNIVRVIDCVS